MSNNIHRIARRMLLLAMMSDVAFACAQQSSPQQKLSYSADPASLPIALAKLDKGDFDLVDVEIIGRWHATQAIPSLEKQFERAKDSETKAKIANVLLRLGQSDGPYWDFLANRARTVLKDGPPTPVSEDAEGKGITDKPPQKLVKWAQIHQMTIRDAARYAMFDAPSPITDLGLSDDKRAIPILRAALGSDDDFVKIAAAQGLAELQDTESVPQIIKTCAAAPKEAAEAIAQSLVYFDDPAAQRAFDIYVPKSTAQELREARANGKTPYR